jgi:hypothetical protein
MRGRSDGKYSAMKSVAVCVCGKGRKKRKCVAGQMVGVGQTDAFSYFKRFVNIIIDNFENSLTDRC